MDMSSRSRWQVQCGPLLGVLDPAVVDADQRLDQALADLGDLAEGQAALVELAVAEPLVDQVADQALDPRRGRLGERPAGALDGVGDHQDAGLLGLRLGARDSGRRSPGRPSASGLPPLRRFASW